MRQCYNFREVVTPRQVYARRIDASTPNADISGSSAALPVEFAALADALDRVDVADPTTTRVLDAAYELFGVVGIQRTSMEDVARRAGVSRQTVYRHVANREALVEQVLQREFQRHVRHYLEAIAAADTPSDRVIDGYLTTLQAIRSNPLLLGLLPVELDTLVASMAESAQHVLGLARLFIAQLLYIERSSGGIAEHVDVELVADVMVRLAVSYILIPSDVVDLDDPVATRGMLRRLLGPLLGWST